MNIDDVLKPYEDDQPEYLVMESAKIERIPRLVDNGSFEKRFQQFFNTIVKCIKEDRWCALWAISDQALSPDEFTNLIHKKIDPVWTKFKKLPESRKGLDVELNIGRFKSNYRSIIGGFFVMFYILQDVQSDITDWKSTRLEKYCTELLYTFKDGQFVLISQFNTPEMEDESER